MPLKRQSTEHRDPYQSQPLPTHRPVAVYYRQSTDGQIGNISTTLQTVDMVEHLLRYGWQREQVVMIDMDGGVSGTRKIHERPGMSLLYEMIERSEIGLVAAQDVDRFFRDMTQIETNIFIDACRRNNVMVMTPRLIYDFAHPTQGKFFMQQFREESQRAADFLDYHIKGRLRKSLSYLSERGMWAGRMTVPGYMVDMRTKLPNGEQNPHYRKYVRFEPHADIVVRIFQLFYEFNGNHLGLWKHMEQYGPFFPEVTPDMIPEGFRLNLRLNYRSKVTGLLMPTLMGLKHLLLQVAYLGHWVHLSSIVRWNNHEAIVPHDLFMFAYNRLSPTDFFGEPNPEHIPQRVFNRHKESRPVPPPTYSGLVFSDDLPERPNARVATAWANTSNNYNYVLQDYPHRSVAWAIKSYILDNAVDRLLLERLQATQINDDAWKEAVAGSESSTHAEVRRLENWIRTAEQTKNNIIASLGMLNHPEMIARAQARYEAAEREIATYQRELQALHEHSTQSFSLSSARPVLEKVVQNWDKVQPRERRLLFEAFAHSIYLRRQQHRGMKFLTVRWRDRTETTERIQLIGHLWEKSDVEELRQMIENNVDQVIIMQRFPEDSWGTIQQRYAYHCNNNRFLATYSGQRKYPRTTRWVDTDEYKAAQTPVSEPSSWKMITRQIIEAVEHKVVDIPLSKLVVDGKLKLYPEVVNKGYFQIRLDGETLILQAGRYVGLIPINDEFAIDVKPRVPIRNLERIIRTVDHTPVSLAPHRRTYATDETDMPSLLDFLAESLIDFVLDIQLHGLYQTYDQKTEDTSFPRGRVLVHRTIQRHTARGINHRATASWFERNADNSVNRCLKYAIWFISQKYAYQKRAKGTRDIIVALNQAYALFQGVTLDKSCSFLDAPEVQDPHLLPSIRSYYVRSIHVAKTIIKQRGVKFSEGYDEIVLASFLINLEDVFEAYVREVLKARVPNVLSGHVLRDGNISGDGGAEKLFFDPGYSDDMAGDITKANPDMVLQRIAREDGKLAIDTVAVIDTKYKTISFVPDRDDLNQLIAYALSYRSKCAIVIHPSNGTESRLQSIGRINDLRIFLYNIDLYSDELEQTEVALTEAVKKAVFLAIR